MVHGWRAAESSSSSGETARRVPARVKSWPQPTAWAARCQREIGDVSPMRHLDVIPITLKWRIPLRPLCARALSLSSSRGRAISPRPEATISQAPCHLDVIPITLKWRILLGPLSARAFSLSPWRERAIPPRRGTTVPPGPCHLGVIPITRIRQNAPGEGGSACGAMEARWAFPALRRHSGIAVTRHLAWLIHEREAQDNRSPAPNTP